MDKDLLPRALTEEKSLFEVYKKSRKIPFNKFNFFSTLFFVLIVAAQYCVLDVGLDDKLKVVRDFATMSLGIVASILGFLIAGFTVFSTISQPEMFVEMSKYRANSGLSYLKNNFFIFMRVFIYYLSYTIFCLAIIIFGVKGGLFHKILSLSPISCKLYEGVIGFSYIILHGGFFFLMVQLKSFIFNVYHSVMSAIRWKAIQ